MEIQFNTYLRVPVRTLTHILGFLLSLSNTSGVPVEHNAVESLTQIPRAQYGDLTHLGGPQ